jgi:dihydrofolate reductase
MTSPADKEHTVRLTLTMFQSLDGVVQSPGAPEEDPSGGFDLGGWLPPFFDAETGAFMGEVFDEADAFLLGRRTYELMAGYWPKVTDPDDPVGGRLNGLPKHVASTTLRDPSWAGSVVIDGDLAQSVAELKRRDGRELQIHGSPHLARSLMAHDLIDTFRLLTFPVVLGRGRRLFGDGVPPTALRHTAAAMTPSGVALHTYELEGRATFGSVESSD